jgi:hypothetical protein
LPYKPLWRGEGDGAGNLYQFKELCSYFNILKRKAEADSPFVSLFL